MVPAFGRLRTFSGVPVGSDTKQQQCAAALVDIIAKTHISRKRRIDVRPLAQLGKLPVGLVELIAERLNARDVAVR